VDSVDNWLVSRDIWTFETWVAVGLGVWTYAFLMGALVIGPTSGRLGRQIQEEGADAPAVKAGVGRLFLLARIELVLLILVVLDMALKPGT